jgi:hypothetical protein
MLRILFRQPLHIWRTFEWRYKLEAIALFILIYAFLGTRLHKIFGTGIEELFTRTDLTLLVANLFTLQISFTIVFLISWLLPRQNNLRLFLNKPLSNKHLFKLIGFHCFKYLSLYLILFLPTATALFSALGFLSFIGAVLIVSIISLSFLLFFIQQKQRSNSTTAFLLKAFVLIFIYHGFFGLFYFLNYLLLFQIIATLVALGISLKIYFKSDRIHLEKFVPYLEKVYVKPGIAKTAVRKIPQFLPGIVQPLIEKEIASLWRNPNYKKLKIKSFVFFVIVNTLIIISNFEYKHAWITAVTSFLIWAHYSNGFNEKYVFADPNWFIKTLPMRFRHLLTAKYFAEIGYVLLLTVTVFIFFQFIGLTFVEQLSWLGLLFVFANTVLFTMLNFQIMFFNDPRLAGYAYHFAMFFIIIMVLNFRLVGPIIGFCLLLFFLYKNVRYFNE